MRECSKTLDKSNDLRFTTNERPLKHWNFSSTLYCILYREPEMLREGVLNFATRMYGKVGQVGFFRPQRNKNEMVPRKFWR